MSDVFSRAKRSAIMSAIRSRDTRPELIVRRLVHSMGYRYRLHDRSLSGCPDLVFRSRKRVIFVHGCFWHRHSCRKGQSMPSARVEFWRHKLAGNAQRDETSRRRFYREGWRVLVVWECQTRDPEKLKKRLKAFLSGKRR